MNRRQAREEAFKILFQLELNDQEVSLNEKQANDVYIKIILPGLNEHKAVVDEKISAQLENWSFDRLAIMDKTILRIAVYEIVYMEDIPTAVSINEAVELAHIYGDDKSSKFINGVLSKIYK